MERDEVLIRAATDDDWVAIWPIWHRIVAAGETYVWAPQTDAATARTLWMVPPPGCVYVAERPAGEIIGTAVLKPVNPGLGDHIANAGFMVEPQAAGAGAGRRLAEYVLEQAVLQGYQAMQFNAVVQTNTRAVALWRSLGFEVLATIPGAFRHPSQGLVGLHVMYRRLPRPLGT